MLSQPLSSVTLEPATITFDTVCCLGTCNQLRRTFFQSNPLLSRRFHKERNHTRSPPRSPMYMMELNCRERDIISYLDQSLFFLASSNPL